MIYSKGLYKYIIFYNADKTFNVEERGLVALDLLALDIIQIDFHLLHFYII